MKVELANGSPAGVRDDEGRLHAATKVFVIDPDYRRRAEIAYWLSDSAFYVEPLESISELIGPKRLSGVLLAADEDQLISHLSDAGHGLPIIAYSDRLMARSIVQALREGASNYLEWPADKMGLAAMILSEDERRQALINEAQRELAPPGQPLPISKREHQVLTGYAQGLSTTEIAEQLAICTGTVSIYRGNILRKLGVSNPGEAVQIIFGENDGRVSSAIREPRLDDDGQNLSSPLTRKEICARTKSNGLTPLNSEISKFKPLSDREVQVIDYINKGHSTVDISKLLNISTRTVEVHRLNILSKLRAKNSSQAVGVAIKYNIIEN